MKLHEREKNMKSVRLIHFIFQKLQNKASFGINLPVQGFNIILLIIYIARRDDGTHAKIKAYIIET